jgi:hypothetical protein
LYTDNGFGPQNVIYLEPEVYAALVWFAQKKLGWAGLNTSA